MMSLFLRFASLFLSRTYIVGGDSRLFWNFDGDFLETLYILDPIKKRNQKVESRFQNTVILSHPFDDPGLLLWYKNNSSIDGQCMPQSCLIDDRSGQEPPQGDQS